MNNRILVILAILMILPVAHAIGTTQTKYSASTYPDSAVNFKIVLFNTKDPVHVSFSPEITDSWLISINPNELDVPSGEDSNEYVVLNGQYVMASPVYVNIRVPENANPGEYEAKVTAQTSPGQGTVGVSQEIEYSFKINVMDEKEFEEYNETTTTLENLENTSEIIIIDPQIIIVAASAIIISIGVVIYLRM